MDQAEKQKYRKQTTASSTPLVDGNGAGWRGVERYYDDTRRSKKRGSEEIVSALRGALEGRRVVEGVHAENRNHVHLSRPAFETDFFPLAFSV